MPARSSVDRRYPPGGLAAATFITLLLVPVFYSIFVLDLRIVARENREEPEA